MFFPVKTFSSLRSTNFNNNFPPPNIFLHLNLNNFPLIQFVINVCWWSRGQLKCVGTRAETSFCLPAKRTSQFKSAGASVQSTTGYTMFWGSVKSTGYPLHSPVPLHFPSRVPSHFNWSLKLTVCKDSFFRVVCSMVQKYIQRTQC